MKLAPLIALALLALVSPATSRAQNAVTAIESLAIQLWPDFDRPAVLVMMTGSLAGGAPLPAFVNMPLLAGAEINAVARVDANGNLFDDILYTTDAGTLSLSTPSPKFRVEYYVPYRVEGGERHFTFDWLADVSVESLSMVIQKPASATSLVTQPPATEVVPGRDGLTYHVLPTQPAPAREPLSVQLSYAATTTALSAEGRPAPAPSAAPAPPRAPAPAPTPAPAPAPARAQEIRMPAAPADTSPGWELFVAIAAAAGVSVGITWQIARNRFAASAGGEKPRAERPAVRPCPGCGLPVGIDDSFCSDCGQQIRGGG